MDTDILDNEEDESEEVAEDVRDSGKKVSRGWPPITRNMKDY